jgi:hypothetical protein
MSACCPNIATTQIELRWLCPRPRPMRPASLAKLRTLYQDLPGAVKLFFKLGRACKPLILSVLYHKNLYDCNRTFVPF